MSRLLTADDIRERLRQAADLVGQKQVAADMGVSASYLNDVLQGRREPADAICNGMGFERIVRYRIKR